ncbi:XPF-type/helicase protein [Raphanus sativus]|nr:XPF-type/helicase protein [Raphanus sativus]
MVTQLASGGTINAPRLPPLTFGEKFEEVYQVIMILDDREQFATNGKKIENICSRYEIKIEVRRLPVGDCIWIARHKYLGTEYVLDFIVERKSVDDMRSSIIDGRYRDQKLRLQRSGLRKLMYILEGDPNQSEAAEIIKTACFTTEILDGFDVLRSSGLKDTLRNYSDLTKSIHQYYKSRVNGDQNKVVASCPSFDSFVKRCQDLEKMTVSDVFAIQLMQVPQVTEEIAIAVVDMFPTLVSLASAYSNLDGNKRAQEEMLRNRSKNVICGTASSSVCLMENNSWTNEEIHQHSTYSGNSNMPLKKPELINNTGIATVWTPEEQTILDNALARYPLDSCVSSCLRYAKISLELPEKTTKDVAMRCRWIKELGRVKVENSISAPHDAVTNELLKQNEQLSEQINANLTSSKVLDNLPLFNQIYENIMELFNKLDENVPDKMKQMPPLREMLNDDLFNLILPHIYLNQHE